MSLAVSDHAVLRWIERVAGVDVAAIRAEIAAEVDRGASAATKARLPVRYKVRTAAAVYVVEDGTVVTVLSPGGWGRPGRGAP